MNVGMSSSDGAGTRPSAWRKVVFGLIALALVGAGYLYLVRGNAIILDLASGMVGMFCF
jgi:hypothetical protein